MTFLVTALQSEARPLVRFFGLRGTDAPAPYRMYRSKEITLVVSGVGRIASAAATAYVFAQAGDPRNRPWINVGIAGHATAEIGSAWLAHKISTEGGRRAWYPSLVFDPGVPTAEVVTVDDPESQFERDAIYDMEASAFFAIASRFALVELVQVVKVVSDNRQTPASRLTPADVSKLIGKRTGVIADLVEKTRSLVDRIAEPTIDPQPWTEGRHFTVSESRRLLDLLRRLTLVEGEATLSPADYAQAGEARGLLLALEGRLRELGAAF